MVAAANDRVGERFFARHSAVGAMREHEVDYFGQLCRTYACNVVDIPVVSTSHSCEQVLEGRRLCCTGCDIRVLRSLKVGDEDTIDNVNVVKDESRGIPLGAAPSLIECEQRRKSSRLAEVLYWNS